MPAMTEFSLMPKGNEDTDSRMAALGSWTAKAPESRGCQTIGYEGEANSAGRLQGAKEIIWFSQAPGRFQSLLPGGPAQPPGLDEDARALRILNAALLD